MDDIDIYSDLFEDEAPSSNKHENDDPKRLDKSGKSSDDLTVLNDLAIIEDAQEKLKQEKADILAELAQTKEKLAKMDLVNQVLKKNISSLYKTAKSELQRKDEQLKDLMKKLDDYRINSRRENHSNYSQNHYHPKTGDQSFHDHSYRNHRRPCSSSESSQDYKRRRTEKA